MANFLRHIRERSPLWSLTAFDRSDKNYWRKNQTVDKDERKASAEETIGEKYLGSS